MRFQMLWINLVTTHNVSSFPSETFFLTSKIIHQGAFWHSLDILWWLGWNFQKFDFPRATNSFCIASNYFLSPFVVSNDKTSLVEFGTLISKFISHGFRLFSRISWFWWTILSGSFHPSYENSKSLFNIINPDHLSCTCPPLMKWLGCPFLIKVPSWQGNHLIFDVFRCLIRVIIMQLFKGNW